MRARVKETCAYVLFGFKIGVLKLIRPHYPDTRISHLFASRPFELYRLIE
jgi:hypothetical protein